MNRTIPNILGNFISHEIIVCDDKDPLWVNNRVKTLIQEKNATCKIYRHIKNNPNLAYATIISGKSLYNYFAILSFLTNVLYTTIVKFPQIPEI